MPSGPVRRALTGYGNRRNKKVKMRLEKMINGGATERSQELDDEYMTQTLESDERWKSEPILSVDVNQQTSNAEPEATTFIWTAARLLAEIEKSLEQTEHTARFLGKKNAELEACVEDEVAGSVEQPDEIGEGNSINEKQLSDDDKASQDNGQHLPQDHDPLEQRVEGGTRVPKEQVAQVEAPVGKELPGSVEQPEKLAEANPTNDKLLPYDNEDRKTLEKRNEELEKLIVHTYALIDEYELMVNQDSSKTPGMEGAPRTNLTLLREARQTERDLKAQLKDLGVQFDDLTLVRDARDKTITELGDASRKYQLEKGKLKEEIKSLRDKVAQLETSNADFLDTFSNLEKKISALQTQLSDQKEELKESDGLLATVRDELRKAKKMLRECEKEKVAYLTRAALSDSMRDDLAYQKRYNAELKMRIVELGDTIEQVVAERHDDLAMHDWEIQEERDSFARSDSETLPWGHSVSSVFDSPVSNTSLSASATQNLSNKCGLAGSHEDSFKDYTNTWQNATDLALDMELGGERPGSVGGSIRSRSSFESPYGASATSGYSWAPGRGSLQENTSTKGQPRSTQTQIDSHNAGTQTDPLDPSESLDPGPSRVVRPSDTEILGSIQKTSSTSEDDSWITIKHSLRHGRGSLDEGPSTVAGTPAAEKSGSISYPSDGFRPSSRQGHGSLHEGESTKGQLWGIPLQSHKAEQFFGYFAIHTANLVYSAGTRTKDLRIADSAIPVAKTEVIPDTVQHQPTASFLSRKAASLFSLFAGIVLVMMILDIHHEKAQWKAANEATRKMAWVIRAGGSYGHPYLSWLLRDAFLEVDAYSYG